MCSPHGGTPSEFRPTALWPSGIPLEILIGLITACIGLLQARGFKMRMDLLAIIPLPSIIIDNASRFKNKTLSASVFFSSLGQIASGRRWHRKRDVSESPR